MANPVKSSQDGYTRGKFGYKYHILQFTARRLSMSLGLTGISLSLTGLVVAAGDTVPNRPGSFLCAWMRGANPRITSFFKNLHNNLLGNTALHDPFPFSIEQLHLNYFQSSFSWRYLTYLWLLGKYSQTHCKWAPLCLLWLPLTFHISEVSLRMEP